MTSPNPKVAAVPKGFRSITASLSVADVSAAMAFYTDALDAQVVGTLSAPESDELIHAQIKVAGTTLLLGLNKAALPTAGTGHVTLHYYLENIEDAYQAAIDAGAVVETPITATWWGDLNGSFVDPFGVRWNLAKRVERVSEEDKEARLRSIYFGAPQETETSVQPEPVADTVAEVQEEPAAA